MRTSQSVLIRGGGFISGVDLYHTVDFPSNWPPLGPISVLIRGVTPFWGGHLIWGWHLFRGYGKFTAKIIMYRYSTKDRVPSHQNNYK